MNPDYLIGFGVGVLVTCAGLFFSGRAHAEEFSPTRHDLGIQIREQFGTRERIIDQCHALGAEVDVRHAGCAVANLTRQECTIYIVRGTAGPDPETEAHERRHCWFGRYHSVPQ